MSDYSAIGDAIAATILADAFLGDPLNVKTVEVYGRGFQFQGDDDENYYKLTELPAMSIEPNESPQDEELNTVGEIRNLVACEITTVSFSADAASARRNHDAIIKNLERVLNAQNTSAAALGIDAYVRDVATETERFKKEKNYFIESKTSFNVDITTTT